jgi:hypothetical protein
MRSRSAGCHQFGKLRAVAPGSGADLGERPGRGGLGQCGFHCGSPLLPALSGAFAVRTWCPALAYSTVWLHDAVTTVVREVGVLYRVSGLLSS